MAVIRNPEMVIGSSIPNLFANPNADRSREFVFRHLPELELGSGEPGVQADRFYVLWNRLILEHSRAVWVNTEAPDLGVVARLSGLPCEALEAASAVPPRDTNTRGNGRAVVASEEAWDVYTEALARIAASSSG